MRNRCARFVLCLVIASALCVVPHVVGEAKAQPRPGLGAMWRQEHPGLPGGPGMMGFEHFAKRQGGPGWQNKDMRQFVELIATWKMMQALELTEDKMLKILNLRQELKEKSAEIMKETKKAYFELKEFVDDADSSDKVIQQALKKVEELEEKGRALQREHQEKVKKELTVRQQAKLRFFMIGFHKRMQQMLQRVKGPGGPEPGLQPEGMRMGRGQLGMPGMGGFEGTAQEPAEE